MFFPNDWIDELIARSDIVQTIGSYVPLKRAGRNYIGLCPFHNEKTASFNVSPDKQFYHCFGCKASGSIIHFIMGMENLSFPEACEHLARMVNLPLPEQTADPEYQKNKSKKERLALANKEAAKLYHKQLWEHSGKPVLDYFRSRGLTDSVIIKFGLGASSFADIILDTLVPQGFTLEELVEAGLVAQRRGQHSDVFKNRAMFPIVGLYGDVLGFGGRALGEAMPKYLNTSDTLLFNKRKTVYAANLLRKQRELKRVLLVEGYMDVIALDQFNISGAAATLGTALTPEQARLMARYAPEIYICYDGDSAGQKASDRAIAVIEESGANVNARVLQIPDGLDPDEYLRQHGKDAFEKLRPTHNKLYQIQRLKQNYNLEDEYQKTEFDTKSIEILSMIDNVLELNNILEKACGIIGISRELLLEEIHRKKPNMVRGLMEKELKKEKRKLRFEKTGIPEEEKLLLSIMAMRRLPFDSVDESVFRTESARRTYLQLREGKSIAQIIDALDEETVKAVISDSLMRDYSQIAEDALMQMVKDCIRKIKKNELMGRKRDLQERFVSLSEQEQAIALQEIESLNKQIRMI